MSAEDTSDWNWYFLCC